MTNLNNKLNDNIRVGKFEVAMSINGKFIHWNGNVLINPTSHGNTAALSGLVTKRGDKNTQEKTGYLTAEKGIREDGTVKFTIFINEYEPIDFVLKQDSINKHYWYGKYYIGKESEKSGSAQLHMQISEKESDAEVTSDINEWFKTEEGIAISGQQAFIFFEGRSNVSHHSFSEEDYNDARNHFVESDQKINMNYAIEFLQEEKEIMERLLLAIINGDSNAENGSRDSLIGKEAITDEFISRYRQAPSDKTIKSTEINSLFKLIVQERSDNDELKSLIEKAVSSKNMNDCWRCLESQIYNSYRYEANKELLDVMRWFFRRNDPDAPRVIKQLVSCDEEMLALRVNLCKSRSELAENTEPYFDDSLYSSVLSLMKTELQNRYVDVANKIASAIDEKKTSDVEALKLFLCLETVAYVSKANSLGLDVEKLDLKDLSLKAKLVIDIFVTDLSYNEEITKWLESLTKVALSLAYEYNTQPITMIKN